MSPALKTVLLVIGSALGGIVVFVAAVAGYFYYQFFSLGPPRPGEPFPPASVVLTPPPIKDEGRFLGTHGTTVGGFKGERNTVLAAGPGKLVGRVTAAGQPVEGLKLQLALNGAVYSQWGTSDADGSYEIAVPYGKYRIDGYMLDSSSADAALAGKVDNPVNPHDGPVFDVKEGSNGKALDLDFVDPVRKIGPKGEFPIAQPLVVSWEPYPGATQYRIQLIEQAHPSDVTSQKRLFEWHRQPKTTATSINLSEHGIKLRKGHHYAVEVDALDDIGRPLSNSSRTWRHADFEAVE
ncbi:MAG: carboxypeptidase-like regulatory domain-containing protein [Burkholderiales bacterium]